MMLLSTLKIALRGLYRDRLYAFLNLGGLALAFAGSMILGLYVYGELTYDRHHAEHERIYRLANEIGFEGVEDIRLALSSPSLGPLLAEEYPQWIEAYVRFRAFDNDQFIRHRETGHYWSQVFVADDNAFDVFTHEILHGDPGTALVDPRSVAVSATFARRYFGNANPIGETITTISGETYVISLVFADLPANTHLKYDLLFSYNLDAFALPTSGEDLMQSLWDLSVYTYVRLPSHLGPDEFDQLVAPFVERHITPFLDADAGETRFAFWPQPLADIHLSSELLYDEPVGNRFYVTGFATVAILLLLVAAINYMNLATARSAGRAREIGMRKVLGARKAQLAMQFLIESVLLSLVALIVGGALALIALAVVPVEQLFGTTLSPSVAARTGLIWWVLGAGVVLGVVSGSYPAFYLSSIATLRGLVSSRVSSSALWLREALVLVQFAISIGVIAATLVMAQQMRHVAGQPLGFEAENRVLVTLRGADLIEQLPALRSELLRNPRVMDTTVASAVMGQEMSVSVTNVESNDGPMQSVILNYMIVEENFLDLMGVQIVAGRPFSTELSPDAERAVLVNETLVRHMGWDQPLGKRLARGETTVIGVVEDFNFQSLHSPVEPFAFFRYVEGLSYVAPEQRPFVQRLMVARLSGDDVQHTLDYIRSTVARFDPLQPLEYQFLDDTLDALYVSERRMVRLSGIFAVVCILIACLGLFGLVAYTTAQRRAEIGIRRALGASSLQILKLLARRIVVLVLIGAAVAAFMITPIMDTWLDRFAYRISVSPLLLVLSAFIAAVIACATVFLQSFRAASTHPAAALRR